MPLKCSVRQTFTLFSTRTAVLSRCKWRTWRTRGSSVFLLKWSLTSNSTQTARRKRKIKKKRNIIKFHLQNRTLSPKENHVFHPTTHNLLIFVSNRIKYGIINVSEDTRQKFGLVVRAAGWNTSDQGLIPGRGSLYTFGCIPQFGGDIALHKTPHL
jgi:hypothetical protein